MHIHDNRICPQCKENRVGPHSKTGLCRGCAISNRWTEKRGYKITEPNPSGRCMCGCGALTPLAKQTQASTGDVKGKPIRFLPQHHNYLPSVPKRQPYPSADDPSVYLVPLTRGKIAKIDAIDADRVSRHSWAAAHAFGLWYARTSIRGVQTMLHRFIMDAEPGAEVDHVDGDGLNNTRANLRFVTHHQNMANTGARRNNKSGYRGVSPLRPGKWRARVQVNGKRVSLGEYDSPEDAARIVDEFLRMEAGHYARLNFPD